MSSAVSSRLSSGVASRGWWEFPAAAVLAVIAAVATGLDARALALIYVAAVTPALCAIDAVERRLPNRLVLPGYLAVAVAVLAYWWLSGEVAIVSLVSGAGYFSFMLAFAAGGGMGMGDVKLAGVLGLSAGLLGPTAAIVSPVVAFMLGGIAAIGALRGRGGRGVRDSRGDRRGSSIPFGPFLLAGFWIAVVVAHWPLPVE